MGRIRLLAALGCCTLAAVTENAASDSDHTDLLLSHAVMAAFASAIPIPILDDAVKNRVQRRMVGALAGAHELPLDETQIPVLADDESAFVGGALKSIALWPLKKALQKIFLVLAARRVVVAASECFQRGFLLDHAFATQAVAPAGPHEPQQVREAVDAVLEQVRGGPIEHAIVASLTESRLLVTEGLMLLWAKIRGREAQTDGDPEQAVEEMTKAAEPGVAALVERLREAVGDVQEEHFDDLRQRLTEQLSS